MDKLSAERRSANMRRIRSTDTNPELLLLLRRLDPQSWLQIPGCIGRDLLGHHLILFFRDSVKSSSCTACFWHQHPRLPGRPDTGARADYWRKGPKLDRNQIRDAANQARLEEQGWKVAFVIWESAEAQERRRSEENGEKVSRTLQVSSNRHGIVRTRHPKRQGRTSATKWLTKTKLARTGRMTSWMRLSPTISPCSRPISPGCLTLSPGIARPFMAQIGRTHRSVEFKHQNISGRAG